ncbi:MAG: DNA polymerase [Cyclobacteriaceae bacterium]
MLYLFTKLDLFNTQYEPEYYVLDEENRQAKSVGFNELNNKNNTIVTFDIFKLIEALRKNNIELDATIIDLSQMYKLVLERPSKESRYSNPTSIDKLLFHYKLKTKEEIELYVKLINTQINQISAEQMFALLQSVRDLYLSLNDDLKKKLEHDRFYNIELPVSQILYKRELFGIKISPEKFENRLGELDKIEYSCQHKLRYEYNVLDGKDNDYVRKALESENLKFVSKNLNNNNIEHILKQGSETNELLYLIYNYRRAKRDKSFLFRFGAIGNDRVFPTFDCIGTITSRILIKSPLIQQLRKSSRDIFIPDNGKEFIYADFGQFEPGILADKSQDLKLIELYNSGDVYEGLSQHVFGTIEYRKIAKVLFLAYMYGMSIGSLSMIVEDLYPEQKNNISEKLNLFFNSFSGLIPYKEYLEKELLSESRIGTSIGNYRKREFLGLKKLRNKEKRWLLSQKIQGTASLILKQAILQLDKYDSIDFLIPMHDAVLFQVPQNEIDKYTDIIRDAFCDSFKLECPSIIPKVTFEPFDK